MLLPQQLTYSACPLSNAPFSAEAASGTEPAVCRFRVRDITALTDTLFFLWSHDIHMTFHPEKPNLNKNLRKTPKPLTAFFVGDIWRRHFCHLKVKPTSCMPLHSQVIIREKFCSFLGNYFLFKICLLFTYSYVFFLQNWLCFLTSQVTLLLEVQRLYRRKHISQKCLCSTLRTAQLPKSNLKWRTTFSNILFRTAHGH